MKTVSEILAEIDLRISQCRLISRDLRANGAQDALQSLKYFILSGEKCPTTGGKHDLVDTGACGIMGCLNCEYETK